MLAPDRRTAAKQQSRNPVSKQGRYMKTAIAAALAAIVFIPATGNAKPCSGHPVKAESSVSKAECLKAHRAQSKRDKLRYPPNATKRDVAIRVPDWQGFVRLGRCEQPGYSKYGDGVRWDHPGPTWGGGLGIYKTTWNIAQSPYRLWSGNKWETILVADAIRDSVGITAWGAHRCFYG